MVDISTDELYAGTLQKEEDALALAAADAVAAEEEFARSLSESPVSAATEALSPRERACKELTHVSPSQTDAPSPSSEAITTCHVVALLCFLPRRTLPYARQLYAPTRSSLI